MVSIICPVFNKARYLQETIQSVQNQISPEWELLLVDDGSTDGSYAIAERASNSDSRIRLFARDKIVPARKGANTCRNIGLQNSKGSYVLFLDADDVLLSHCVSQRLTIARNSPSFDIYLFDVAYSMKHDQQPFDKLTPTSSELFKISQAPSMRLYFLSKFLAFDLPWHTTSTLWNRKYLLSVGGFDENFQRLQDPEVHTRVLLDEQIRINYQMGQSPYDALHLKDDARQVWTSVQFQKKQIDSIALFISKFVPLVKETVGKRYLKYMRGYLVFAETLTYRYIRENLDDLSKIKTQQKKLYSIPFVGDIEDLVYKMFIRIYRLTLTPWLIRMRVPGFLLLFYRKLFL